MNWPTYVHLDGTAAELTTYTRLQPSLTRTRYEAWDCQDMNCNCTMYDYKRVTGGSHSRNEQSSTNSKRCARN